MDLALRPAMTPFRRSRSAVFTRSFLLFFNMATLSVRADDPPVGIEELPSWRLRPGETRTLSPGKLERY